MTTTDRMLDCKAAFDEAQDAFDNGPDERYTCAAEDCRAFVCESCVAVGVCQAADGKR